MQSTIEHVPQLEDLTQLLGTYVLRLFGPLMILVIGWLVALVIRTIVREVLHRTSLDNRLAGWIFGEEKTDSLAVERLIAQSVYYLALVFVAVAFFQALGLAVVTEPLNRFLSEVFQFAPRIFSAALLLCVGGLAATVLKRILRSSLERMNVDARFGDQAGLDKPVQPPISQTVSEALFWIVVLLFVPGVLNVLALESLFRPLEGMVEEVLGFLPNLLGAGIVLIAGWFVARVIQRIATNLLVASGLDRAVHRAKLDTALGGQKASALAGLVVYGLLLLPVAIAALNALQLDAITQPASRMLDSVLGAIPLLFAAGLLLLITFVAGKLLSGFITNLLSGLGFDGLLAGLGLYKPSEEEESWKPSAIVGSLVLVATLLIASIEALSLLEFTAVAGLVSQFTVFAGKVLLGLVIFAVSIFLSRSASSVISASGAAQSTLLSVAAQISIVVLGGAIALRQMGLANEIIDLAFGLLLGAVTIAAALAFGLGGREVARQELEEWISSVKKRPKESG